MEKLLRREEHVAQIGPRSCVGGATGRVEPVGVRLRLKKDDERIPFGG
jgi:hypothetical protein